MYSELFKIKSDIGKADRIERKDKNFAVLQPIFVVLLGALSPPYKIVGCTMGLIMIIGLVQLMSLFIPC